MSTVKIACPKCIGFGLIGTATESRCPQCLGTGTVSVDDTLTLSSINTTEASRVTGSVAVVVTAVPVVPPVALKVSTRGK